MRGTRRLHLEPSVYLVVEDIVVVAVAEPIIRIVDILFVALAIISGQFLRGEPKADDE